MNLLGAIIVLFVAVIFAFAITMFMMFLMLYLLRMDNVNEPNDMGNNETT
jgi:heme/copper-type cytochrome/quinol oxidase subunit 2